MTFKKIPVLSIIPARGGSKGINLKNLKLINNKPLIYFTINASLESEYIDITYLSSDNEKILDYANKFNINCIKRPKSISTDRSTAVDVVSHIIKLINKDTTKLNPYIVYLQPTSPLRKSKHIDELFKKMKKLKRMKALSVVEVNDSPFKTFKINKKNQLKSFFDQKYSNYNRQFLPKTYKPNGAMYIFRLFDFIKEKGFPSNGSYPYIMSQKESIDIDNINDLNLVKKYLK